MNKDEIKSMGKIILKNGLFFILAISFLVFITPSTMTAIGSYMNISQEIMGQINPFEMIFSGRVSDIEGNKKIKELTDYCAENPSALYGEETGFIRKEMSFLNCTEVNQVNMYYKNRKLRIEFKETGELLFQEM